MKLDFKRACMLLPLGLGAGLVLLIAFMLVLFEPDRPVDTIAPGSSPEPAFVAQIIRPRLGLPLGGILPPQLFGFEAHIGFDSTSPGAFVGHVGPGRIELGAEEWELILAWREDGKVAPETEVIFKLLFEERVRILRCWPADPAVGTLDVVTLPEGELAGSFDIELAHCRLVETEEPLAWPTEPLVLHGSFDRLPAALPDGLEQ